ncbi:MAG TPA: hypothetical protein DCX22_04845 [Dehalococcoidia bacterium]|nr:hypothetical protein [Dehalococcoidia bacterium]
MIVSEKVVADLWRRQRNAAFTADDGSLIEVIFPGRPAYGGGCDFTDCVFTRDGVTLVGNTEIHAQQRDWHAHGHDADPHYNSVVLHVVMRSGSNPVRLHNGTIVPTICLEAAIPFPLPVCDYAIAYERHDLSALVENEGYLRFLEKAASIKIARDAGNANHFLLCAMAAALGYSRNVHQFKRLADVLTTDEMTSRYAAAQLLDGRTLPELMASLFGIAGLLPSQRGSVCTDLYSSRLERIWRSTGYSQVLKETDWCFSGVRPNNYPTRRIAALGYLLHRWGDQEIVEAICRLIDAVPLKHGYRWLEPQLIIDNDEYWDCHSDFGIRKSVGSSLLGGQRANDMLVNVILPGVYALSGGLAAKALHLYVSAPGRGENEITRYMKQQLAFTKSLTACQQQGLIRLFRMYCRKRDCLHCPVGSRTY